MPDMHRHGVGRLVRATQYSWQGAHQAFHNEAAFREEVAAAVVMIPLALWLAHSAVELVLLVGSVLLVLIVELLNTAIENVVDRISEERHRLSGRAKDMGSAAVLLSLFIVILTWGCILLPRYI